MQNFTSKTNGETIGITFRPMEEKDAPLIIECLREEYGETYYRAAFYDPISIWRYHTAWKVFFVVAETESGEIMGFMGLESFRPEQDCVEMICQVFRKKYRGYCVTFPMLEYSLEIIRTCSFSAITAHAVSFHDISQRTLRRLGLFTCGFEHGVLDRTREVSSFPLDRLVKHGLVIMVMAQNKKSAGTLFVPPALKCIADTVYSALGVEYTVSHCAVPLESKSVWRLSDNNLHNNYTALVDKAGDDLEMRIKGILSICRPDPLAVVNIYLNCSHPTAIAAYDIFKKLGFFCAGIKPLSCEREYIIMHHPMKLEASYDQYTLESQGRELLNKLEALK